MLTNELRLGRTWAYIKCSRPCYCSAASSSSPQHVPYSTSPALYLPPPTALTGSACLHHTPLTSGQHLTLDVPNLTGINQTGDWKHMSQNRIHQTRYPLHHADLTEVKHSATPHQDITESARGLPSPIRQAETPAYLTNLIRDSSEQSCFWNPTQQALFLINILDIPL